MSRSIPAMVKPLADCLKIAVNGYVQMGEVDFGVVLIVDALRRAGVTYAQQRDYCEADAAEFDAFMSEVDDLSLIHI